MRIAVRIMTSRFRRTMRSAAATARPFYPRGRSHPRQSFCSSSDRPNSESAASGYSESDRRGRTGTSDYYSNQQFQPHPPPSGYDSYQQSRSNPAPEYFHSQQFQPPPRWSPHLSYPGWQSTPNQQMYWKKPPDSRTWEVAKTTPCTSTDRFTVLSYNILADYLVWEHKPKLYYHIPPRMLDWKWRKTNLLSELASWSTDIMCFQEVDRFGDLEEEFKQCGYKGIWKRRTGVPRDGCAIFWRESRFNLLHEESIDFSKFGLRNNVAQICVLELVKQGSGISTSPSSTDSSKVIICNTHLLFNPKRGEIKLAQVRILLETAHAVSKKWNDAPIVLCGDFNSVPKSPLYNYISEQKLDLSTIGGRDKVSGQDSAEIRPPSARRNPSAVRYGKNVVSTKSELSDTGDCIHNASTLVLPKSDNLENKVENLHLVGNAPRLKSCNVADAIERSSEVKHVDHEGKLDEVKEETQQRSVDKSRSAFCISNSELEEGISASSGKGDSSLPVMSHSEMDRLSETEVIHELEIGSSDDNSDTSNRLKESINHPAKKDGLNHYPQISSSDDQGGFSGPSQADMSSTLISTEKQAKIADLFQTEFDVDEGKNEDEDESTFLSALHHNDGALLPHTSKTEVKKNQNLDSIRGSSDVGQKFPESAEWVPFELEIATGRADCTTLEHPLKLRSTYTEAEDFLGIRDSNGEPLATTHHKCFMGTVDYIWRSEGLKTVRVLAPVPKHVMQETGGFPTKKWGSDHIALATELAFAPNQTKP